eukprot:1138382-Pelagomonas_calceolata.AAC.12
MALPGLSFATVASTCFCETRTQLEHTSTSQCLDTCHYQGRCPGSCLTRVMHAYGQALLPECSAEEASWMIWALAKLRVVLPRCVPAKAAVSKAACGC